MDHNNWHLLKVADEQVYGPAALDQLKIWAAGAKISPQDRISNDNCKTWLPAPMFPELQMDWLIQREDNLLYGPTNIATLQEFLAIGEIDADVTVINTLDGSSQRIKNLPFFKASPHKIRGTYEDSIAASDLRQIEAYDPTGLKPHVTHLEKQVIELQKELLRWQEAYENLEEEFVECTGRDPR